MKIRTNLLVALTLLLASSCGGEQIIVWDGKDIVGFFVIVVLFIIFALLFTIAVISDIIKERKKKSKMNEINQKK